MKKVADPYMPEVVNPVVDTIFCAGSDDQTQNVKNWLTKLRRLKGSIANLGQPTRKIWIIWLTNVMLGTKERLVYLVPHKAADSTGKLVIRYNYLLIGKDGGSLHPDPIFINKEDIRALFKKNFDQRFEYIFEKLKLVDRDYYYTRLKDWVDTLKDGEVSTPSATTPELIEFTRMLDHDQQQEYKSKKELKAEAKSVTVEDRRVKNLMRTAPSLIKEMATLEQIKDSGMWRTIKAYTTPFFDAGHWGNVPKDQVAGLNALTNLVLYPHSTPWVQFFADTHIQKANWLATHNGTVTGEQFLPSLYPKEIMSEIVRHCYSARTDHATITSLLSKSFKTYLERNKGFLTRSNLAPVQFFWSDVVVNDDGGHMVVDFIANDYASYARLSLAFGAGNGKITNQKALYIRNAFSIPKGKLAHVVIMNLFPSTTAMVDHAFLAMCNFGDGTVIGKVLTLESFREMTEVSDLDILRVQFTDIPSRATAFTRDILINKLIEWRELCLSIVPTDDLDVNDSVHEYVPVKDMLKILLSDLLNGASMQVAHQEAREAKKKGKSPSKTPELSRTVQDNNKSQQQSKKFGVSLADQLAGVKVDKSPTLTGEGHLTTVTKEQLPEPEPVPISPVKQEIQEKKKAEQKAKRMAEKAATQKDMTPIAITPERLNRLTKVQQQIVLLFNGRIMLRPKEIREELKRGKPIIYEHMQKLIELGVVTKHGQTRGTYYTLNPDMDERVVNVPPTDTTPEPAPESEVPSTPVEPSAGELLERMREEAATNSEPVQVQEPSKPSEPSEPVSPPEPEPKLEPVAEVPEVPKKTAPVQEFGPVLRSEAETLTTTLTQRFQSSIISLCEMIVDDRPSHIYIFYRTTNLEGTEFEVYIGVANRRMRFEKINRVTRDGKAIQAAAHEEWKKYRHEYATSVPKGVMDAIDQYFGK